MLDEGVLRTKTHNDNLYYIYMFIWLLWLNKYHNQKFIFYYKNTFHMKYVTLWIPLMWGVK